MILGFFCGTLFGMAVAIIICIVSVHKKEKLRPWTVKTTSVATYLLRDPEQFAGQKKIERPAVMVWVARGKERYIFGHVELGDEDFDSKLYDVQERARARCSALQVGGVNHER